MGLSEIEFRRVRWNDLQRNRRNHARAILLVREDKLNYRYPRGESYRDIILRLEPVISSLNDVHLCSLLVTSCCLTTPLFVLRDIFMICGEYTFTFPFPFSIFKLNQLTYSARKRNFGIECVDALEHPELENALQQNSH